MALTAVSTTVRDWWLSIRPGTSLTGSAPSNIYNALVSDIAAGDYLCGIRATVTATGSTVSGVRTLTVRKMMGSEFTVQWPAASSVQIGR